MNEQRKPSWPARSWRAPLLTALAALGLLVGILAAMFLSALFFVLVTLLALVALLYGWRLVARRMQRSPGGAR